MQPRREIRWGVAVLLAAAWVGSGQSVVAGQAYLVGERFNGHLWRIEDITGDGDALDIGEKTLWADNFVGSLLGMEFDGGAAYVTEQGLPSGGARVVRLTDTNGDGDALDIGETSLWADGLADASDIVRDSSGRWFVSDLADNRIWTMADTNGDGDALDIGEQLLFTDAVSQPMVLLAQDDALIVARNGVDLPIHRLGDRNGDGDALDVGENLPITPNQDVSFGLLDDGAGGFYFSSFSDSTVYQARDRNGDGDMLDVGEVLSYADPVFGLMSGPTGLAAHLGGGFLLADFSDNQVKLVRDTNGDGDALDLGEVVQFADGITGPIDMVAIGLPGDYNFDGSVDAADYVLWRKNDGTQQGYDTWRANFGQTAGSGSGALPASAATRAVPEPSAAITMAMITVLSAVRRRRRLQATAGSDYQAA